jgi:hypothetical protein
MRYEGRSSLGKKNEALLAAETDLFAPINSAALLLPVKQSGF